MEVEFCPPIGPVGANGVNIQRFSMDLSVQTASYIYEGVGNCLVVKKRGRHHTFLAHVEHLGETG